MGGDVRCYVNGRKINIDMIQPDIPTDQSSVVLAIDYDLDLTHRKHRSNFVHTVMIDGILI